ncbi:hypothetical protein BDN72DRAFT_949385 [Pluteus cervinus]|uniref:Uncharacterized protein n=1 Tax=Pluteus cervinus TaxID=181527 RepID=A0ACD3AS98_9AGAR|nr:hypothetical protein BDN72DRAFT_949385 [Pluteus cervinus]
MNQVNGIPDGPKKSREHAITLTGDEFKPSTPTAAISARSSGDMDRSGTADGDEDDWDRIDFVSDLDAAARGLGRGTDGTVTVRGSNRSRSPCLYGPPPSSLPGSRSGGLKTTESASQVSLGSTPGMPQVQTRLSNIEELNDVEDGSGSNDNGRVASSTLDADKPSRATFAERPFVIPPPTNGGDVFSSSVLSAWIPPLEQVILFVGISSVYESDSIDSLHEGYARGDYVLFQPSHIFIYIPFPLPVHLCGPT